MKEEKLPIGLSCNYSLEARDEYLYVKAEGHYDEEIFLGYPQLVREACIKHGKRHVMFNGLEVKNIYPTTTSRHDMGMEIANAMGDEIKVALIWPQYATNYYSQAIAEIHGTAFKVFNSTEPALEWLLG